MSRQQIHARGAFDRSTFLGNERMRIQFHVPVRFENIRPPFHFSFQFEAPAVVWGRNDRCWAFLHDFDEQAISRILEECRRVTYQRRGAYMNPFAGR